MISIYNIHRSPAVWDDPDAFQPERFGPLDGPVPTEQNTDYRYIPFSGGPRCSAALTPQEALFAIHSMAYATCSSVLHFAQQRVCLPAEL